MNKARRKKIASVIETLENITGYDLVETAKDEIEDILWEEDDAYNNMPENLQYSMRGEESSDAIDSLQETVDALEEAIDALNELYDLKEEYNNIEDEEEKLEKESEIELKEDDIDNHIYDAVSSLEQII